MIQNSHLLRVFTISATLISLCSSSTAVQEIGKPSTATSRQTAPSTTADAKPIDPATLRSRIWTWVSGTAFGDGTHTITIADKSCDLGPTLPAYRIRKDTKLNSIVNSAFLSKSSFNVSIYSNPDGQHMVAENEADKEICSVKFDFRKLKINESDERLEMVGICSYEILLYSRRKGKEKPHFKKKEDGVPVLFTAPWPSASPKPSSEIRSKMKPNRPHLEGSVGVSQPGRAIQNESVSPALPA